MKSLFKKSTPLLLLFLGVFLLIIMSQPIPAGICIVLSIVIPIERMWPEKWGNEGKESC